MLFRQFFDQTSSTYTYLLASRQNAEAIIIDPVKEQLALYQQIIGQLGLQLVYAIDTHIHADHVTALGDLRSATACITIMGESSRAECVSQRVSDGQILNVDGVRMQAIHTPGHTSDSFSFVLSPEAPQAVFTGDVLLIRGTGRTDFQGGDPGQSWDSIVNKLFVLPDDTALYPAHDYKGWTVSTIGEEKRFNPRLAGKTKEQYVATMQQLNLPNPKMMDIALPANMACGQ